MPADVVRLYRTESEALAAGTIHFHPRYEYFLRRCGIDTAADAFELAGEVVCGHADRHVARVRLAAGHQTRVAYLKREHVVGLRTQFKNARAGFGWVSKCEREVETLKRLERAGLPGPQWLAYGTDGGGRAFLLIDELPGADVRGVLGDRALSHPQRRTLIRSAGRTIAAVHGAGFAAPELAAKHLFVGPDRTKVTLIDWQSAPAPGVVSTAQKVSDLAGFHASLPEELASPRQRLLFLREYLGTGDRGRLKEFVRLILKATTRKQSRSSVRDQRQNAAQQKLVWLQGEAVCVVPALVAVWPRDVAGTPFYVDTPSTTDEEWITFADGRRGLVVRWATVAPLARLSAAVRERPWRSPGATAGRILFHLERFGIPAPRLLAFGQRTTGPVAAKSFVVFEPASGRVPLRQALANASLASRRILLRDCGDVLRKLHDAGCRLNRGDDPTFAVTPAGDIEVTSPLVVKLSKRIPDSARRADLSRLIWEFRALTRTDRLRVAKGYAGPGRTGRDWVR